MTPNLFTNAIKQLKKTPSSLLVKLSAFVNKDSQQAISNRFKHFLTQVKHQYTFLRTHSRRIASISTKYAIIAKKRGLIATNSALFHTKRHFNILEKALNPLKNTTVIVTKKILLIALSLLRHIKGKADSLIHSIILLTEKAIVMAENIPEYAYRLFIFTEKQLNALITALTFLKTIVAIPTNIVLSFLLEIIHYIKRKSDALIYSIILLTEKAIVVAENIPEYAYRLFIFTEKQLNALITAIIFLKDIAAIPTNKALSLLRVILRYITGKFDSLIYSIILLTEKVIFVVENTPDYAYRLFAFTERALDSLANVLAFVFAVAAIPVNKALSLILTIFRYIKGKFDSLIHSIILLTEKIIFVAESTPACTLKATFFAKDKFVLLTRSTAALIYKIIVAIRNGAAQIAVAVLKIASFIKELFVSLIYKATISIKNGTKNTKNIFVAIKNKLHSRINIFILKQKLNLIKVRNKANRSPLPHKLKQYALLIRLDKPIGILLLLWPTLMALWIAAEGWPDQDVLLVFVAGVFLMRSAGCAINDYADRHIDCKVSRTKNRPLTSGKITEKEALIIFSTLCITAFILVLFMNALTIAMSVVGVMLAASYPFMKRHTYLPQVHLGAAFGWAVPMAYTAQTNEITTVTWLLFIATVLWTTAYDTMYAMVDREDDLKIGVKSTAILFESADTLIIGIIQALLILCLIMIGQKLELGLFYFTGVLIATGLAVWQQRLIRDRQPAQCFQAFLNNNWFGLALFVGVFLEYQIGGITL